MIHTLHLPRRALQVPAPTPELTGATVAPSSATSAPADETAAPSADSAVPAGDKPREKMIPNAIKKADAANSALQELLRQQASAGSDVELGGIDDHSEHTAADWTPFDAQSAKCAMPTSSSAPPPPEDHHGEWKLYKSNAVGDKPPQTWFGGLRINFDPPLKAAKVRLELNCGHCHADGRGQALP